MSAKLIGELNALRTLLAHLHAQVEAGVDTRYATLEEARAALADVEARLAEMELRVRELPEAAYLFRGKRKRGAGRTRVLSPQLSSTPDSPKEGTMARKSNAAALEETLVALRRAEKSAGTTKWALEGKGAEKNPPTPQRKKALKAKLASEQARVAELRAARDELKSKVG